MGDAGPLLRPGRQCGRAAFGPHFRPRSGTRRSAGPPSRPRPPAHQHSARHRRGRRRRPALPAARGARSCGGDDRRAVGGGRGPEARPSLRRGGGARTRAFREVPSHHGSDAAGGGQSAAPDGRRVPIDPRQNGCRRLRAAPAARESQPAAASRRLSALWRPMRGRTVHVVGAGVAGLSAAVRLAEAGLEVIVHEAAQAAGGRCRSYADQALGLVIDNGNHLLLSGNHTALDYLDRIGSRDTLSGPGAAVFDFADLKTGERWRLSLNEGRAPWWLFDRKRRAPGTALREYFAPLTMLLRAPAAKTVAQAMSCAGPLYERLWRPLLLAGLNTDPLEGSAALAAGLMRETLGAGGRACHPLLAGRGLSRTFIDPALAYLVAQNGAIRLSDRLREIRFAGARAVALEFESRSVKLAEDAALVIAVPPLTARELLPGLETPDEFRAIVNAHFRVEPLRGQPAILGVVNGMVEWLFAYPDRLSVTISNADRLIDRPRDELAAWLWREVAALSGLPADLPPWRIVKEKRATFAATPAQNAKRPPSRTRWDNIALAGDWTQTGLPATIEGAVRSGYKAASIIIGSDAVAPKSHAMGASP